MGIFSVSSWKKIIKKIRPYSMFAIQTLSFPKFIYWIWIHECFCSLWYFFITFISNTFLPSLTLSASIHARSSRLGNYTAGFMLQYNFLCRWNRRMNVKTFLDPIQTAWKFIAKHEKNEYKIMINEISNSTKVKTL